MLELSTRTNGLSIDNKTVSFYNFKIVKLKNNETGSYLSDTADEIFIIREDGEQNFYLEEFLYGRYVEDDCKYRYLFTGNETQKWTFVKQTIINVDSGMALQLDETGCSTRRVSGKNTQNWIVYELTGTQAVTNSLPDDAYGQTLTFENLKTGKYLCNSCDELYGELYIITETEEQNYVHIKHYLTGLYLEDGCTNGQFNGNSTQKWSLVGLKIINYASGKALYMDNVGCSTQRINDKSQFQNWITRLTLDYYAIKFDSFDLSD